MASAIDLTGLQNAMSSLGALVSHTDLDFVKIAYQEAQRHYHTLQHIRECMDGLSQYAQHADRVSEVEIALWMHDLVYNPRAKNNERLSAEKTESLMSGAGISKEVCQRVFEHIMATATHSVRESADSCLVMDIDMLILASSRSRLLEYEQQIRQEYSHVPRLIYRFKRKGLLKKILKQEIIFYTPDIQAAHESLARDNLEFLIAKV